MKIKRSVDAAHLSSASWGGKRLRVQILAVPTHFDDGNLGSSGLGDFNWFLLFTARQENVFYCKRDYAITTTATPASKPILRWGKLINRPVEK